MPELSREEAEVLVQHAIRRHGGEAAVVGALAGAMSEGDVQRTIDTLIGTQRVRRIGPDVLENNESHTPVPPLPGRLEGLLGGA